MMFKKISQDKIEGINKGDIRYFWYKGDVREVIVKAIYNHQKQGICVDYKLKIMHGNLWVDIEKLFLTKKECIAEHISILEKKYDALKIKKERLVEELGCL